MSADTMPEALRLARLARSPHVSDQAIARAARPDYPAWLAHVRPAAGCARPIRLAGTMHTVRQDGDLWVVSTVDTATMPDGVIYKPCGNRREAVCPSCSARYKRDAYEVVRSGLVGGNGIPEHVAQHPAVFPTFTAPSFGEVHTSYVAKHTCKSRRRCDCRPEPCHARRDAPTCPHGVRLVCFARHTETDRIVGSALCRDCYDYSGQAVWNAYAGELWRRTTIRMNRYLRRIAKARGIDRATIRLSFGKAAEMQRRAVVHFHAIARLDGRDPDQPGVILPPPIGLDAQDLVDAVNHAVATVRLRTAGHPDRPGGWPITWGEQTKTRIVTVAAKGEVTDDQVANYLAKYATKSTEVTGHVSGRITDATINVYADPDGSHTERLVEACWMLGRFRDWRGLRQWAHMFGFGGHFLTKSRTYSVTFATIRNRRVVYCRTESAGPGRDETTAQPPTTVIVNFLEFVGAGWHTAADAMLANTSAAMAREHQILARQQLTALAA